MASKMTALRIPEDSLAVIDRNAKAAGMNRSAWMIEAALHYEQPADELDSIRSRLAELERIIGRHIYVGNE